MQRIVWEIQTDIFAQCACVGAIYDSVHSEEPAEQERKQPTERKRSSTDPIVMSVPTSNDLDSNSMLADTDVAHHEQKRECGIVPPNLTLLHNGAASGGATSLDDIRPMFSTPTTPQSTSYNTKTQYTGFGLAQSQPNSTNISMRSISQSSQDPYSSYSSSTSSHVSSSSSLIQGSVTEAVLERTSVLLLHQVTADLQKMNPSHSQPLSMGTPQFGYQYGHSKSFHGTHATYPESNQLQPLTAQTLPIRLNTAAAPTQPAIQGPTISEIYSDPEELERGKTEDQSKNTLFQRRSTLKSSGEGVQVRDYDDSTLRSKQKKVDSPDIERSRTPKVTDNTLPKSDSRDFDRTLAEGKTQPSIIHGAGIVVSIVSAIITAYIYICMGIRLACTFLVWSDCIV